MRQTGILAMWPCRQPTCFVARRKPIYTPHVDTGDFVIVINADKVRIGGKKDIQKVLHEFFRLCGRP